MITVVLSAELVLCVSGLPIQCVHMLQTFHFMNQEVAISVH